MTIAIIGASGFLGVNLAKEILRSTDWNVRAIARNQDKLKKIGEPGKRLQLRRGDILDYDSIAPLIKMSMLPTTSYILWVIRNVTFTKPS